MKPIDDFHLLHFDVELEKARFDKVNEYVKYIEFDGKIGSMGIHAGEANGVTRTWILARDCYVKRIWAGTIQFASTTVERAINLDECMREVKEKQMEDHKHREGWDWLLLNHETLRNAKRAGLPIQTLMEDGESIAVDNPKIKFVERRNKIAHGDYRAYTSKIQHTTPDGIPYFQKIINAIPAEEAEDQLIKCSKFIRSWVDQNPCIEGFFE
ncbi:MAG: hypothetical protein HMLIMOIP_000156 [Candidatus Nitrosomirales archaeon]|jgi:hypothetical protein